MPTTAMYRGEILPVIDIEQQKKRAKELLKAHRAGDRSAARRIGAHAPRFAGAGEDAILGADFPLSQAQLVIARENGFSSWTSLKRYCEAAARDFAGRVDMFISAACSGDMAGAQRLLDAEPAIARANIFAAAVLGEVATVERLLDRQPDLAKTTGGPQGREPLLYLCFSRFLRADASRAENMARVAELLLRHGADPNAYFRADDDPPNHRQTALYGAAGIANNAALTRLLLEAGADPNDGVSDLGPESLYHASEFNDTACLRLLLEHKPDRDKVSYCLARKLDFEDQEGVRLYLEHGADPNFRFPWPPRRTRLHHAVMRGRSVAIIEDLLQAGADPRLRDDNGVTSYALAMRLGRNDLIGACRRYGATEEDARSVDAFLGACVRADRESVRAMLAADPGLPASLRSAERMILTEVARLGAVASVRLMLDVGFDITERGEAGMTALHWAAWYGRLDTVDLLIERGAPLEARNNYGGSVLSSTLYAARHVGAEGVDYAAVVERLIAAGAKLGDIGELRTGDAGVDTILDRWLVGPA